MNIAAQPRSYNAKQMNASKRKQLALAAMAKSQPLTEIAQANNVSRKCRVERWRGKILGFDLSVSTVSSCVPT